MEDEDSHDHVDAQDDLVFDDDDWTWGDVVKASEAEEPRFDIALEQAQTCCQHQVGMTQLQDLDPCLLFH